MPNYSADEGQKYTDEVISSPGSWKVKTKFSATKFWDLHFDLAFKFKFPDTGGSPRMISTETLMVLLDLSILVPTLHYLKSGDSLFLNVTFVSLK